MLTKLRKFIKFYSLIRKDPRVPSFAKWLPWLALGYIILPFDFSPDFLPILGQLDDVGILAILLNIAINAVSNRFYDEYEHDAEKKNAINVTPK